MGVRSTVGLVVAIVAAYAASLDGGFLNYDDPWLIRDNPWLANASGTAWRAIWLDLSDATRMALGAEYLPIRDLSHWIEFRLFGPSPVGMRVTNLVLYVAAVLLLRGALLQSLVGKAAAASPHQAMRWTAEIAVWLFALHPVHAESVAWLAGRKDVLALLFIAAALWAHAADGRHARVTVPLFMGLAMLSKGVAVAAPLLLPSIDLLRGRRIRLISLMTSLVVVMIVLAVQMRVGAMVGMTGDPVGGSRAAALATMGPAVADYLFRSLIPVGLSVAYDLHIRAPGDLLAWVGYLPVLLWILAGVWAWRRGHRWFLVSCWWFVVPMLPTSQVLVPLQNVVADRYLLLSVLGPCVLLASLTGLACTRPHARLPGLVVVGAVLGVQIWLTADRAVCFSDSVLLWQDATTKTRTRPLPVYQLGRALDEAGDVVAAQVAFSEAIRRAPKSKIAASATGHLARLVVDAGRLDEAERIARQGVKTFPNDPKMLNNLAEIVARQDREPEARHLYERLINRFPGYETGRRNFQRRYGTHPGRP